MGYSFSVSWYTIYFVSVTSSQSPVNVVLPFGLPQKPGFSPQPSFFALKKGRDCGLQDLSVSGHCTGSVGALSTEGQGVLAPERLQSSVIDFPLLYLGLLFHARFCDFFVRKLAFGGIGRGRNFWDYLLLPHLLCGLSKKSNTLNRLGLHYNQSVVVHKS